MAYIPSTVLVTKFTGSGTWTKNSRTKFVEVFGWNSGGSGASGRKGASTSSGGGGGGINGVANSGAGGNGARGEVWVIEYF